MGFRDIIKKSVLEGFGYTDFPSTKIVVTLGITFAVALYMFYVYKLVTKRTFYSRDFNVSMAVISLVTAGIIMAMQSNLVISLGMVGALSVIRFRTAIKEPMDLLFLFWSISIGIICGAGLYEMAIMVSLAVTVGLLFFQALPVSSSPYLLVVRLDGSCDEDALMHLVRSYSPKAKLDSKNIQHGVRNLILEVRTPKSSQLVDEAAQIPGVISVTLMQHNGEVKA